MATLNIAPTKSNFLSLKRQLAFAEEGYDLLEQKRQILIFEMMSRLGRASEVERNIAEALRHAHAALREAALDIGSAALDRAALGAKLEAQGIPYHVNRRLVRGLDYYNGVVFEITAEGLGAQNAVAGGGRYNNLYQELGGSATPCTGFSIGIERLLTAIEAEDPKAFEALRLKKVYFAPLEDHVEILRLCRENAVSLRETGIRPETAQGVFSLSQHLKKANQLGLRFMVIAGPEELQRKKMIVKDLEKREQIEVDIGQIVSHLKKVMNLC